MDVTVSCHRHPDRAAGVSCQRCNRPICPQCMRQASVGFQCPDCTGTNAERVVRAPALFRGHSEVIVGKVIIGINVAVWLVATLVGGDPTSISGAVYEHGALFGPLVADGDWWRVVTGSFMHSGVLHLGMNMLLLWFLSQELEPALGRVRFAILYGVSLVGGSLGVLVLSPLSPTVGASGAVFGLMGALIVLQLRAKQNPWQSGIGGLVLINLLLTFAMPNISVGGHLGGLLAGAAAGAVLQPLRWPQEGAALRSTAVVLFGVTLLVGAYAAAWILASPPYY
ncbi:MAG: rhomboid family intramembrane serine protease [Actinomycetota bacterium]|nr:rhomboid family intramembrane serine protease [Actinomycetota bacterium]